MSEQQKSAVRKLEANGYRQVPWHSETPRHICVAWDGQVYDHLPLEQARFAVMLAK